MYDMKPYLDRIDRVIEQGPYKDTWESLSGWRAPEWFGGAKLGIFTHWGLYSVPEATNEWYSRNMYIQGMPAFEHHVKTYGTQDRFGYKDFIPMFTAEGFDPEEWIRLFKAAGARYICPVAEHHDGFQMYDSEISDWNTVKMGPHRDIIGEIKAAAEAEGMTFCTSSHRAEHWWFMSHGREFESDVKDPMQRGDFYWPAMPEPDNMDLFSEPYPTDEYLSDWLVRTCEIIDKYRPAFLYFDWWLQHDAFRPYMKKLAAYYYNRGLEWGKPTAICYKYDGMSFGTGIVEVERGGFADTKAFTWQTDTAVARNSWCYTDSLEYKSSREIICTLIDVVSKGGNLLLNIGPRADGSIGEVERKILGDMADWIAVNGEGIYDSKVWRTCKEGPTVDVEGHFGDQTEKDYTAEDYRFTAARGCIYAFAMKCPEDGTFLIKSFADAGTQEGVGFHGIIDGVKILGFDESPAWEIIPKGLLVRSDKVTSEMPVGIKIITR